MRIYVKCDRCGIEGAPKRGYTHPQGNAFADYFGRASNISYTVDDAPPESWCQAKLLNATYLLCSGCTKAMEGIIRAALMAVPK